jgi:LysR family transcriptional regulator, transcription activator of glutamate synthase operon
MRMDTDALRWFQQVADGVTVTEVSELERVTQSGVSRALSRLEREVGTPLLRRSGRTLRMTHAGSVFKRHVDAMLHQMDDGLAAVDQLIEPETGTVALAFELSLGTWLVPDLVSSFRADHPSVQFELKQVSDELLTAVLGRGEVDLEISTFRRTDPTVQWRRLLTEPLRLAVGSEHPLARRAQIRLGEVSSEPFIMLRPTSLLRQLCDDLCEEAGFSPALGFEGDDLPTVLGFVAAGLGVAIVPALRKGSPDAVPRSLHYVEISDPRAARAIGLTWSTERRLLPAAELFRQHTIDRATARLLPDVAKGG